ncbi:type 1 glutamine amidotransferase [soil metagenome]
MRLLVIEHEHEAGAGVFADPIAEHAFEQVKWRPTDGDPAPSLDDFDAVLALGGAMNVDETKAHPWIDDEIALLADAIERSVPTLGVCLGSQLLAAAAGAKPGRASESEIGFFEVELSPDGREDPLLSALPKRFSAFQWHSYAAPNPPGAVALALSPVCLQAFRTGASAWGIQFHAEVTVSDALTWTAHHADDPAFAANGLDPQRFAADIRERMPSWNELGRALCERFCTLVGD